MRYIAAYLLALLGGNKSPSEDNINKILDSVGISGEREDVRKLLSELQGKDIYELIAAGQAKLTPVRCSAPQPQPCCVREDPVVPLKLKDGDAGDDDDFEFTGSLFD